MKNLLGGLFLALALVFMSASARGADAIRTCSCEYTAGNPNDNACYIQQKVFTRDGRFLSLNVISGLFPCPYCTAMLNQLSAQCR